MACLSCRCLNIQVFTANNEWWENPLPVSKLLSEAVGCETLYEVNLDVAGIVLVRADLLRPVTKCYVWRLWA